MVLRVDTGYNLRCLADCLLLVLAKKRMNTSFVLNYGGFDEFGCQLKSQARASVHCERLRRDPAKIHCVCAGSTRDSHVKIRNECNSQHAPDLLVRRAEAIPATRNKGFITEGNERKYLHLVTLNVSLLCSRSFGRL